MILKKIKFNKLIMLLLALLSINGCQKSDDQNDFLEANTTIEPAKRLVKGTDIPEVIQFIRNKSNYELQFSITQNNPLSESIRGHEENLILTTALTDEIGQFTISYGKSNYVFKLIEEQDKQGVYFLNLIVREYMDSFYLYIVKYVPTNEWVQNYSGQHDFSNFEGNIFFYSDLGVYLAKAEILNGTSISIEKSPCVDDPNNGGEDVDVDTGSVDTGSIDGSSSGSSLDDLTVGFGWLCNWRGQLHTDPSGCNNPGMGGAWTILVDYGNGDRSINNFLKNPCDEDDENIDNCYSPNGDPCPNGCDEFGECLTIEEIENPNIGVNIDMSEVTDLTSQIDQILGENETVVVDSSLESENMIDFDSIEEFEDFYNSISEFELISTELIEQDNETKTYEFDFVIDPLLNIYLKVRAQVSIPNPNTEECLTIQNIESFLYGNTSVTSWEQGEIYDISIHPEYDTLWAELTGSLQIGLQYDWVPFFVTRIYTIAIKFQYSSGEPIDAWIIDTD